MLESNNGNISLIKMILNLKNTNLGQCFCPKNMQRRFQRYKFEFILEIFTDASPDYFFDKKWVATNIRRKKMLS